MTTDPTPVALVVVAFVVVANPLRALAALPDGDATRRVGATALGAAIVVAVATALAGAAGPALDVLDTSTATARLAAGAVVALTGCRDLLARPPEPEPAYPGLGAALVPVALPLLCSPALVVLALSSGADHGALAVATSTVLSGALVVLAAAARRGPVAPSAPARRAVAAGGRVTGAVAVAAGMALVVAGIFDI